MADDGGHDRKQHKKNHEHYHVQVLHRKCRNTSIQLHALRKVNVIANELNTSHIEARVLLKDVRQLII